jgi:hypothetical protein
MMDFKGHRALVTGASIGIGKNYAEQLASYGCDLVITARRADRLEELAFRLQKTYGVEVQIIVTDLKQAGASQGIFQQATASNREVSILINNAGIGNYGDFLDYTHQQQAEVLSVNALAPTELTYLFSKHMLHHGRKSHIVHVASIGAFQPVSRFAVYCATKGYLLYFSEALSFELKHTNIAVMCLCPGGTYTEFFDHSHQKIKKAGNRFMMSSEKVVAAAIRAMWKERTVCIPGILNKMACFLPRFLPRSWSATLARRSMEESVEAFPG